MEEQNLKPTERHIFETVFFLYFKIFDFSFHFTVKYGLGLELFLAPEF